MAPVRVAQLDRASGYGPEGRGFESCHAHFVNRTVTFMCGCLFFVFWEKNSRLKPALVKIHETANN